MLTRTKSKHLLLTFVIDDFIDLDDSFFTTEVQPLWKEEKDSRDITSEILKIIWSVIVRNQKKVNYSRVLFLRFEL